MVSVSNMYTEGKAHSKHSMTAGLWSPSERIKFGTCSLNMGL